MGCHDAARTSTTSAQLLLPAHPECEECHDLRAAERGEATDPDSRCEVCHPGFDATAQQRPPRIVFPVPNVLFDHAVHVKDRKIDCKACHGSFDGVQLATRMQLPKMETCLECHDGREASAACGTCHLENATGRLRLSFASGLLRPMQGNPLGMDHGPRYEFTHGAQASARRETCLECHAQRECDACHDSLQKPLSVHPNDYVTLHPIQARQDTTRCESCHRYQSFCVACHERVGVGMSAQRALRPANVRVHPPQSTWTDVLGPQHHGIAANRDLRSCVSCHREQDCTSCHSEFATRRTPVNPHPSGFAAVCRSIAAKNDRACLACHSEGTLASRGCR
jgi:hypothetical protein